MSWWVYLTCPTCHQPLPVEQHQEGGTYVVGGSMGAELNVTYNYAGLFCKGLGMNFRELDGKKAEDVTQSLKAAVEKLGTERDDDYWAETSGNAGYALSILLRWARQHPNGIFEIH